LSGERIDPRDAIPRVLLFAVPPSSRRLAALDAGCDPVSELREGAIFDPAKLSVWRAARVAAMQRALANAQLASYDIVANVFNVAETDAFRAL
jgi:hypothetical protein